MPSQPGEDVSYTVRVDCSGRNLTTFPSLPSDTTVLDLSYNLLDQVFINFLPKSFISNFAGSL